MTKTLKQYLRDCSETQQQFADRIGANQGMVSGWCNGVAPSLKALAKIQAATNGEVGVESWFPASQDNAA